MISTSGTQYDREFSGRIGDPVGLQYLAARGEYIMLGSVQIAATAEDNNCNKRL